MEEKVEKIDLMQYIDRYFRALIRFRVLLLSIIVICAVGLCAKDWLTFQTTYSSKAVFVTKMEDSDNLFGINQDEDNDNMISTFTSLMTGSEMQKILMDELNAFEQRMDERLTDEMGKISSIEQQVNQILPILKDSVESDNENREVLQGLAAKLEKTNADVLDAQTNAESALNSKSEAVILNIEEVKNLIQLLAVNELLDEINAEERTQ